MSEQRPEPVDERDEVEEPTGSIDESVPAPEGLRGGRLEDLSPDDFE
ncbi:hypothetical protein [Actinomadura rifamycini]|nr:hypothetical protein [Actinomadura rifamycini]